MNGLWLHSVLRVIFSVIIYNLNIKISCNDTVTFGKLFLSN